MKTLGVLGGMGPEATAHFFSLLVSHDTADRDQDHLRIVVECDPSVPDRTAFLLGKGEDPLPALLRSANRLEDSGVDLAGIPCMTAHAFLARLRQRSALPFISAFEVLAERLDDLLPPGAPVGILATVGSRKARLFESHLGARPVLWPSEEDHATLVMEAIYGRNGIKAGVRGDPPRSLLAEAASRLAAAGAKAIIAGCTEVPLALSQSDVTIPFIDPMDLLAKAMVDAARPA